jgi:hypothetical protein
LIFIFLLFASYPISALSLLLPESSVLAPE